MPAVLLEAIGTTAAAPPAQPAHPRELSERANTSGAGKITGNPADTQGITQKQAAWRWDTFSRSAFRPSSHHSR